MTTILTILAAIAALWMALMFCIGAWVLYLAVRDRIELWRLRPRVSEHIHRLEGGDR